MRIAVTGHTGQIGRRLVSLFCIPLKLDILDKDSIRKELKFVHPDLIIHCAGLSSIEECEKDYDKAMALNAWGTAALCEQAEGKVVFLSSEQVFDGNTKKPYKETDTPNPINNYGLSKYAAESIVEAYGGKIIRLSRGFSNRIGSDIRNYWDDLLCGKQISVPNFIYRNYSHLDYVAIAIYEFTRRFSEMPPLLNIGGSKTISFYELMHATTKGIATVNPKNIFARKKEQSGYAKRPFRCGLDVSLAQELKIPIYDVEQSVRRFLTEKPHDR